MACNNCDVILLYYLLRYIKQYLYTSTIVHQSKLLQIYLYGHENEMRCLTMMNNDNDAALHTINEFNKNRYEPLKYLLTSNPMYTFSLH